MQKLLSEFSVGEGGRIVAVKGEGLVRRRLFDMGVTPGAEVLLRKTAPLGDPLELTIRGYELTLRKAEAACVLMEVNA
ncbi:MAG: FeoA domain-containing protein [Clostridia bacterium]|nr:FeoA domain-containing protein [Clostridia bacterium]